MITQQQAEENLKNFTKQVDATLEVAGRVDLRDAFRQFVKEFKKLERVLRQWDQTAIATSNVRKEEPKPKIEIVN